MLLSSLYSGLLITGVAYMLAFIAISFLEKADPPAAQKAGFWQELKAG
ncbi:MAG: hypothetical protein ACQEU9_13950 [Bacillota bacterium]